MGIEEQIAALEERIHQCMVSSTIASDQVSLMAARAEAAAARSEAAAARSEVATLDAETASVVATTAAIIASEQPTEEPSEEPPAEAEEEELTDAEEEQLEMVENRGTKRGSEENSQSELHTGNEPEEPIVIPTNEREHSKPAAHSRKHKPGFKRGK